LLNEQAPRRLGAKLVGCSRRLGRGRDDLSAQNR
jgi:hypothetical protein